MSVKIDRVGDVNVNIYGSTMTIIKFRNSKDLEILFDSGFIYSSKNYQSFKNGKIKSPYCKTVFNIGYLGEGSHLAWSGVKASLKYDTWFSMMRGCYDGKQNAYKECVVDDNWHNFQVFCDWFDENYYTVDGDRMELDKDILVKGNKIYSASTCTFVPQKINSLFVGQNSNQGKYPIGVYYKESNQKYCAQCSVDFKKRFYIGLYDTPQDAFNSYKDFKEKYIKQIAERYKEKIPSNVYNAMIKYEIHSNI